MEKTIADAYRHVNNAKLQRALFNTKQQLAREDAQENKPHNECCYTLVGDYCQNMRLPHFGGQQPGDTYYYSPLNVNCFGIVDVVTGKLYAHLY